MILTSFNFFLLQSSTILTISFIVLIKLFLTAEDAELRSAENAEEEPVNLFLCVLCVISLRPLRLMDFNPMCG
jgi:hypothetical protein